MMIKIFSILGLITQNFPITIALAVRSSSQLFPNIADVSHATPDAASFFNGYFEAKSRHDADAWLSFFDPTQVYYYDASLGGGSPNRTSWVNTTHYYTSIWGDGAVSYPVRVLGDLVHGAIVQFTDTAQLFGDELRIFSAIDFRNKSITRQIDYWDGRGTDLIKTRVSDDKYPTELGIDTVSEKAASIMKDTVTRLQGYFSTNNHTAAAQMFSYDGIFEEFTLRARQESRLAIEGFLQRILPSVPYGRGATVRHVLGTSTAGGYEWYANSSLDVLNGVTALELDANKLITRLTVVWEASNVSNSTMKKLASKAVIA